MTKRLKHAAERVRQLLNGADLLHCNSPGVAAALSVSNSTLRRTLKCEGTSFQVLLNAERVRRFKLLWGEGFAGKQMLDTLGFTQLNSMYRFLHTATGKSLRAHSRLRRQRQSAAVERSVRATAQARTALTSKRGVAHANATV